MDRRAGRIHLGSVLFGAFWAAVGILVTERTVGPLLARRAMPPEEQTLASVHRTIQRNAVLASDPAAMMRAGALAMLQSLHDPYASWVGPEDLRAFEEESTGTYVGIGAMLAPDGRVIFPLPGGPAEAAGLRVGDRILAVDGVDSATLGQEPLAQLLRGPKGSEVTLELQRQDGARAQAKVRRRAMPSGTVGDVRWLDEAQGIAHAHLRSFAESTARELDLALDGLAAAGQLRGLVLDLRWNVGGQLEAAIEIAARFLRGGPVCTLRDHDGTARVREADPALAKWPDLPLAILINGRSASGSEVLAGALRDRGAAVLLGERSYGKGIYQEVYRYEEGAFVLKFTAGEYLTPAGHALEGHLRPDQGPGGLEPDVPVPPAADGGAAVHAWLNVNWPPAALRAEVDAAFPGHLPASPPPDAALAEALAVLRRALAA